METLCQDRALSLFGLDAEEWAVRMDRSAVSWHRFLIISFRLFVHLSVEREFILEGSGALGRRRATQGST